MNYYNKNNFDSAIVEFSNAVAIFPEYADAYLELGNCYDNKSDMVKALENYLKAGEYDKRYILFAYGYECAFDDIGIYDEAIAAFSQCIAQKINTFIAYCMRGNSHSSKYDFENAYIDYSEAISISPNIFQPYFSRGALNIIMGNFQQAITDLETSKKLYPDFEMADYFLDLLYEMFGDRSKLLL
jgi:tetratricopeptide (TPR) repeat protein